MAKSQRPVVMDNFLLVSGHEFHLEGLSNFSSSVGGLVQIQDVNSKIYKCNTKLILNMCMNSMVHVSSAI